MSTITGENHLFLNGIYNYALNERIIDSIQTLTATVLTVPFTPLIQGTDFNKISVTNIRLVDVTDLNTADPCEVITGWIDNADATTVTTNAVNIRQGSFSLTLGKSGIATDTASYSKVLGTVVDGKDRDAHLWFRVADMTTLNKIKTLRITYGSGGSAVNSKVFEFDGTDLETGFQLLRIDRTAQGLVTNGQPSLTAINFLKLDIVTNNPADTITSGDLNMDFWFFAPDSEYTGDLVEFVIGATNPDTNTNFTTDYTPLSKEVFCEAEAVGTKYNVSKNKIIFKVSNIPGIDNVNNYDTMTGGSDLETDTDLRERIKNASLALGKATVKALEQAVLAVEGVTSVQVNDMPLKTAIGEPHNFLTGTDEYKVDFEVAQNTPTLQVTGTVLTIPGYIFVNGTDFILEENTSKVIWQTGGTKPDNDTFFFVDYDYRWLGHVEIFVAGAETPLPVSVITAVNTAVDDTRAAGIDVDVFEPTVISVDINTTVVVETSQGFSIVAVKQAVLDNLTAYMNSLQVGVDVFRAELTRIIQETPGVENSTVAVPASDVIIAVSQIAKPGIITVL